MPHAARMANLAMDHEVGREPGIDTQSVDTQADGASLLDQEPRRIRPEAREPQRRRAHRRSRSGSPLNASQPVRRKTAAPLGMRPLAASNAVTCVHVQDAVRIAAMIRALMSMTTTGRMSCRRVDLVQERGALDHVGRCVEMRAGVLGDGDPAVVEPIGDRP